MRSLLLIEYHLTYKNVDTMLDYGSAYFKEKDLEVLLGEENRRGACQIERGLTEGFVPRPVLQGEVKVEGEDIEIKVTVTHNVGFNGILVGEMGIWRGPSWRRGQQHYRRHFCWLRR